LDGERANRLEGRVTASRAPAPEVADHDAATARPRFHYTLVATSGAVLARHETDEPLHCDDELRELQIGDETGWRVVSVLGAMATVTRLGRRG
jgi:hypothetical protein